MRQAYHCGWLDSEEWRPLELPPVGPRDRPIDVETLGICPGWLVRQRAVIECCEASLALKTGHLSQYVPNQEAGILEGAMLAEQAFNVFQVECMKRAGDK